MVMLLLLGAGEIIVVGSDRDMFKIGFQPLGDALTNANYLISYTKATVTADDDSVTYPVT